MHQTCKLAQVVIGKGDEQIQISEASGSWKGLGIVCEIFGHTVIHYRREDNQHAEDKEAKALME